MPDRVVFSGQHYLFTPSFGHWLLPLPALPHASSCSLHAVPQEARDLDTCWAHVTVGVAHRRERRTHRCFGNLDEGDGHSTRQMSQRVKARGVKRRRAPHPPQLAAGSVQGTEEALLPASQDSSFSCGRPILLVRNTTTVSEGSCALQAVASGRYLCSRLPV